MCANEHFGVSLPVIWRTVQRNLVSLADGLRRILETEG